MKTRFDDDRIECSVCGKYMEDGIYNKKDPICESCLAK